MSDIITVQEQLRRYAKQLENWPGMKPLIPTLEFAADVIDQQAACIRELELAIDNPRRSPPA